MTVTDCILILEMCIHIIGTKAMNIQIDCSWASFYTLFYLWKKKDSGFECNSLFPVFKTQNPLITALGKQHFSLVWVGKSSL